MANSLSLRPLCLSPPPFLHRLRSKQECSSTFSNQSQTPLTPYKPLQNTFRSSSASPFLSLSSAAPHGLHHHRVRRMIRAKFADSEGPFSKPRDPTNFSPDFDFELGHIDNLDSILSPQGLSTSADAYSPTPFGANSPRRMVLTDSDAMLDQSWDSCDDLTPKSEIQDTCTAAERGLNTYGSEDWIRNDVLGEGLGVGRELNKGLDYSLLKREGDEFSSPFSHRSPFSDHSSVSDHSSSSSSSSPSSIANFLDSKNSYTRRRKDESSEASNPFEEEEDVATTVAALTEAVAAAEEEAAETETALASAVRSIARDAAYGIPGSYDRSVHVKAPRPPETMDDVVAAVEAAVAAAAVAEEDNSREKEQEQEDNKDRVTSRLPFSLKSTAVNDVSGIDKMTERVFGGGFDRDIGGGGGGGGGGMMESGTIIGDGDTTNKNILGGSVKNISSLSYQPPHSPHQPSLSSHQPSHSPRHSFIPTPPSPTTTSHTSRTVSDLENGLSNSPYVICHIGGQPFGAGGVDLGQSPFSHDSSSSRHPSALSGLEPVSERELPVVPPVWSGDLDRTDSIQVVHALEDAGGQGPEEEKKGEGARERGKKELKRGLISEDLSGVGETIGEAVMKVLGKGLEGWEDDEENLMHLKTRVPKSGGRGGWARSGGEGRGAEEGREVEERDMEEREMEEREMEEKMGGRDEDDVEEEGEKDWRDKGRPWTSRWETIPECSSER